MAQVHGKGVTWSLDGVELAAYGDATDPERTADSHETTTYGLNSKRYSGGLKDGTCTVGGVYESGTVDTPRIVIEDQLGETVVFVYRPEGTGTGKPMKTVSVVITGYTESAPVGDMIRWSAELQYTGDCVVTSQV
ncbi:hypothetical protein [Actinophytocola sp. NPDC049390]|uniref:hypothetical protein n=1 Tax=Actinophytocola sp. NPDC049390 TaxID=3363894 RepID=UPI0037BB2364